MGRSERFLRLSILIFNILAWLSLGAQVITGLILLVGGGPSVPIGGLEVPARVVGILNCVAGGIYFFMLVLVAHVIRVLLEIRERLEARTAAPSYGEVQLKP